MSGHNTFGRPISQILYFGIGSGWVNEWPHCVWRWSVTRGQRGLSPRTKWKENTSYCVLLDPKWGLDINVASVDSLLLWCHIRAQSWMVWFCTRIILPCWHRLHSTIKCFRMERLGVHMWWHSGVVISLDMLVLQWCECSYRLHISWLLLNELHTSIPCLVPNSWFGIMCGLATMYWDISCISTLAEYPHSCACCCMYVILGWVDIHCRQI